MDRIELIQKLQEEEKKKFQSQRKPSIIVNNFFSLVTIVIMTITIIIYVNYIAPAQAKNKRKELKRIEREQYLDLRAKQIALSHKLNKQ